MRRTISLFLGNVLAVGSFSVAVGQNVAHLESLLSKLADADAQRGASLELASLAKGDPASRQYIANRLPPLLATAARAGDPQLLYSSVGLVTELKAVEAVPVLTELLRQDSHWYFVTGLLSQDRLYDNPIAYALSELGDPATQPVAKLFDDGDAATRRRAAIVLGNIATPLARQALVNQIQVEQVDDLRAVMQDQVTYIDQKARLGAAR